MNKSKMSKQDKIEWELLYEYVRTDVMGYDKKQSLSKYMVLRLKGMTSGKFYANNKIADNADYSFNIVLLTFKLCKSKISSAIANKSFDTELKKFNYICAIVENNLNDTYMRIKNAKQNEHKTKGIDSNIITHKTAEYKIKTEKTSSKLNDLW